jgi:hypothetical protein
MTGGPGGCAATGAGVIGGVVVAGAGVAGGGVVGAGVVGAGVVGAGGGVCASARVATSSRHGTATTQERTIDMQRLPLTTARRGVSVTIGISEHEDNTLARADPRTAGA